MTSRVEIALRYHARTREGEDLELLLRTRGEIETAGDAPVVFVVRGPAGAVRVRSWNGSLWSEVMGAADRPLDAGTFRKRIAEARGYGGRDRPFQPFARSDRLACIDEKEVDLPALVWSTRAARLEKVPSTLRQIAFIGGKVHVRTAPPMWNVAQMVYIRGGSHVSPEWRIPFAPPTDWIDDFGYDVPSCFYHAVPGESRPGHQNLFAWERERDAVALARRLMGDGFRQSGEIEVTDRALAERHRLEGIDLAATARGLRHVTRAGGEHAQGLPDDLVRVWLELRRSFRLVRRSELSATDVARRALRMTAEMYAAIRPHHGPKGTFRHYGEPYAVRWSEFEHAADDLRLLPDDADDAALGALGTS